tara:strand:- start:96 stop:449 length:354 start_codon:yes stop_codon:yes gene_type:complete
MKNNVHTLVGSLVSVGELKVISEKFQVKEIVVTVPDGEYSETMQFDLCNKSCDLADDLNVGSDIEITFSIKGREYNEKYYHNLRAFKVVERETEALAENYKKAVSEEVVPGETPPVF